MAMVLNHNMSSVKTLNTLKKNDSDLAKALKKASSGMKINGAGDGASEYAIGSKMDVMIRSLDQDRVNSETGRNLVAVAEGGIQEIINNIRSMKEMAINAANDHNTDADRATIQKEFSSRMQTISDIAAETNYNGRYLLNGDYYEPVWRQFDENYAITMNTLQLFPVDGSPLNPDYDEERWAVGLEGYVTPLLGANSSNVQIYGVPIDFSNGGSSVDAFDGQGFITVCNIGSGLTHGFASVVFTKDLPVNTGAVITNAMGDSDSSKIEYRIGINGANTIREIEDSLYNAVTSISGSVNPLLVGVTGYDNAVGAALLTPEGHNMQISKGSDGRYMLVQNSWEMWVYNGVLHDQRGMTGYVDGKVGKPLIIHTGPKQNQELRIFINSMSPIAMGLNGASVLTRSKASAAMGICDRALDYALNENTRMGAYMSRLDFTKENLVTAHENVTAAKSTILDADMAATMTEFHKQNVLTQSAQLMLAQSNQNSSRVLSLLQ